MNATPMDPMEATSWKSASTFVHASLLISSILVCMYSISGPATKRPLQRRMQTRSNCSMSMSMGFSLTIDSENRPKRPPRTDRWSQDFFFARAVACVCPPWPVRGHGRGRLSPARPPALAASCKVWYCLIENGRHKAIACQRTRDLEEFLHRQQYLFL